METVGSLEYLRSDLRTRLKFQTKRLRWERGKALTLKTTAVVLAAGITVLLGLEGDVIDATVAKNVALVFAAVIVVVNAWEAFFNHRGLWMMHTINRARLEALATDIELYMASHAPGEVTEAEAHRFAERYREIGGAGLGQWLRLHDQGAGVEQGDPAPTPSD